MITHMADFFQGTGGEGPKAAVHQPHRGPPNGKSFKIGKSSLDNSTFQVYNGNRHPQGVGVLLLSYLPMLKLPSPYPIDRFMKGRVFDETGF
jgi:hypothetical protein